MAVTDIDEAKLETFVGHVATELGAAVNAALVLIGDQLGLYRAMADGQPVSSAELASRTGTQERYVREWLATQAAVSRRTVSDDASHGATVSACNPLSLIWSRAIKALRLVLELAACNPATVPFASLISIKA